jgi:hypothetical protein
MHEAQIAGAPEELKPFYTARRQRLTEIGDLTSTLAKIPVNETTAEARAALTKQIDFKKAQVDDTTQLLMAPDFGKAYPIYLQLERERNEASGSTAKRWASASENYIKRLKVENAINARNTAEARGNVFSPGLLPSPTGFPPMNRVASTVASAGPYSVLRLSEPARVFSVLALTGGLLDSSNPSVRIFRRACSSQAFCSQPKPIPHRSAAAGCFTELYHVQTYSSTTAVAQQPADTAALI